MKVIFLTVFSTLALSASAQVTRSGSKYLIRVMYKKGSTVRYLSKSSMVTGPKKTMTVNVPMTLRVLNVVKGVADIKVTVGPVTANGAVMQPARTTPVVKVDSLGRPVDGSSTPMMSGNFPVKPVGVGETWSSNVSLQGMPMKVTMNFIFRGLKTVAGKSYAVVGIAVNSASNTSTLTGRGEMSVAAADGIVSSMNLAMTIKVPASQTSNGGSVAFTTTMVRK